ncbi:PREDICTED: uncharacterized protein LOC109580476 [Amphimedon queenslandica]|uniref:DIX domain-containing protein n=1 Tax=Amphimedon queenslandica TaxID=400682 RepID=A0A1X7VGB6_AMPQE|nr:PREDICTED: uncharacterized protein LOC109580476 [Amphimedon queenslandica]|eukprot:XP_019849254.1 PREDICTED: uncharacterized protein LOC109580476 [Amphimedon queenslandica]
MASSDPELALEEALRRIQGDHSNESEPEDTSSTVSSTEEIPTDYSRRDTSIVGQSVASAGVRLLCMPPRSGSVRQSSSAEAGGPGATRSQTVRTAFLPPRSSRRAQTVNNSKDSILTQTDFSQMVYEKLESVARERHQLKLRAQTLARQLGKPIKDIMSLDWSDAPDSNRKFISLSPEEKSTTTNQREPSCSDSGLGFSYLGQSYSDLRSMDEQQDCLLNQSTCSSKHSYHSSLEYNSIVPPVVGPSPDGPRHITTSITQHYHHPPSLSIPDFTSPVPSSSSSFYSGSLHHQPHHSRHQHPSHRSSPLPYHTVHPLSSAPQSLLPVGTNSTAATPLPLPPPSQSLLVAYTIDTSKNTFAKRINLVAPVLTLRQFKDDIFARKGSYRYFFKKYCEELSDVILEEATEDMQVLPLYNGSIVGHVEKIERD